jgi:hypothetical protein
LAGQLCDYDFGYVDLEERTLATSRQPVWRKSVTYEAGTHCYLSVRSDNRMDGAGDGNRT